MRSSSAGTIGAPMLVLLCHALGAAEDGPVSDRPGFSDSPAIVGRGALHIESGFAFQSEAGPAHHLHRVSGPYPLLRLGINDRLELRWSSDGVRNETVWNRSGAVTGSGAGRSDAGVGFKWKLRDEDDLWPAVSVMSGVSIPVGSRTVSSAQYDPYLKLAWARRLGSKWEAGGNFNLVSEGGMARNAVSLVCSRPLGRGFGVYGEVYREGDPAQRGVWTFDSGISRSINRNMQVDIEAGHTLFAGHPSWFLGFGYSMRLPLGLIGQHR